jgi:uncharacterized protein YjhX (UPF0386 family)
MSEVITSAHALEAFLGLGEAVVRMEAGALMLRRVHDGKVARCDARVMKHLASSGRITRNNDRVAVTGVDIAARDTPMRRIECPLDLLRAHRDKSGRRLINDEQWQAGERLRSDFTRAHMLPGIGMRWSAEPASRQLQSAGGSDMTDAALAARRRVNAALDAVGPELSGLLLDVCCFLKGLETVELERRLPARSAKVLLGVGLSMLARHYQPPKPGARTLRHWGSQDFRPGIQPAG